MIHFVTDTISPILLNNGLMVYYLSEFLNQVLDHLYGLLFAVICKNMKHVDELYAGAQKTMKQNPQQQNI